MGWEPMAYLVDGYNLVGASPQFNRSSSHPMNELVRYLNRFARVKKTKITVVFDGFPPDWNCSRSLNRTFDSVTIVFTGSESDADTKIRRMISEARNRRRWIVVSSDRAVHGFARVSGIQALRSEDFLRAAEALFHQQFKEETKMENSEMDYWLDVFGEKTGKGS